MLKKIFNRKKFLYSELAPKARFLKILELHVLPVLEKDGFNLLKSGPSLKKIEGSFEWIVDFNASKWNFGNEVCQYNPYFTVKNSDYRKFLKKNPDLVHGYGESGYVGTTSGIQHWNKNIFSLDNSEAYFLEDNDFVKYDNLELVDELIKNIKEVGLPYFEMMSDFDGIKNFHINQGLRKDAPKLIDLCYVLNRTEEVKSIFDWYESTKQNPPRALEDEMEKRKEYWLQHGI